MKIIYQGKEVGLPKKCKKVIDMFGDSVRISPKHIVACKCNNEIKTLEYEIKEGDTVELIDMTLKDGMQVYLRGLLYVLSMAFDSLYPDKSLIISHKISNSIFCELENEDVTEEIVKNVKKKMKEIIDKDLPFVKKSMTKEEAEKFYKKNKTERGKLQVENENKEEVTLYFCEDYYNYFYGVMPLSTGYVDAWDIKKYKDGLLLRHPNRNNPTEISDFVESKKFLSTLREYNEIYSLIGVATVKELNEKIKAGKGKDLVLISEALQEKRIAEIADEITKRKDVKIILIAGPSSSGKTTFAKRLGIQLRVNGLKPVTIGTDNYFVERPMTPRDEKGDYDFETIEALDLDLFNDHLTKLLSGKTVEMPTFDFTVGTKRYDGKNILHLADDEVLVIEGIHCLNDRLTAKIPKNKKFKIYISDLTVLNIDNYNRISSSDTREIRRMVRDNNFRGYSALETIKRWPSVTLGESKNIFPFQEEADEMFNSSLVYEHAVLAKHAKPLLEEIKNDCPEYAEAKRLLSFLEYFQEIEDEVVPMNSLMREFIDGSIFDY